MYEWDERIFLKNMNDWGYGVLSLDCGLGDHYAFLNILPELKKKWKYLIIGACYPEVFEDLDKTILVPISALKATFAHGEDSIYKWMIDHKWENSIEEAFRGMYL